MELFKILVFNWRCWLNPAMGRGARVAMCAVFQIVLRRPRKWSKTTRLGIVTAESAKEILATN